MKGASLWRCSFFCVQAILGIVRWRSGHIPNSRGGEEAGEYISHPKSSCYLARCAEKGADIASSQQADHAPWEDIHHARTATRANR